MFNNYIYTAMNKTIFIIAILLATIFGSSYLIIKFNPQLQSRPWIKPIAEVFGLSKEPVISEGYKAVFCIFDPSGSGKSTYSVPIITVDFIQQLISSIADKGHGELWLTFVDRSALNNEVLHFTIPENIKVIEPPIRKAGQRKGEYDKKMVEFRVDSAIIASKMTVEVQSYNDSKEKFLKECGEMISKGYAPKKSYEDYSDVIGSLNAAVRSLATLDSDSLHFRSIFLISDGVQDVPTSDIKNQLNEIPDDIILVTINHGGSLNSVVARKSIEVDNLDRGLEKTIRVYKPKNQ